MSREYAIEYKTIESMSWGQEGWNAVETELCTTHTTGIDYDKRD